MTNKEMIAAEEFCSSHNVELSFLEALSQSGLLEVSRVENTTFISYEQLPDLEKLIRFHYDMDINLEGIEAIHHLLQQIKVMQQEMKLLRSRLGLYEQPD
jgi:hypothetical protein